jgi:hypothetical protein
MTEQPTSSEPHDPAVDNKCPPVDELLKQVIADINAFDAKKLSELRTELEAFINIKDKAITEYKNKYDDFLNRWGDEGKQIEQLRSDLLCSYPDDAWKKLIQSGVCPVRAELHTCKEDIKSLKACKGKNEKQRDETKDALDAALTTKEAWKTAIQKIDQGLNYNQDVVKQIQNLNQGQDRAFRVYLLWFKLLPSHNKLRPGDKPVLYPEETPENLCGECKKPGPTQGSTSGLQNAHGDAEHPCAESDREAPWIVDPKKYPGILDHAFCDYKSAKETYAQAVAVFQAQPDDLPSVTKICDGKSRSFEDDVKNKLRDAANQAMVADAKCS